MISAIEFHHWRCPRWSRLAFAVWRRNAQVWLHLMVPSLLFHFVEPLLYLLGFGLGFGSFIGEMGGMDYFPFLASGMIASSGMMAPTYEGLYSVYTRMVPQKTYHSMLATPLEVDDIVTGELLWCATKGCLSGSAILLVATLLGAISSPQALLCIPILFLVGLAFSGLALAITAVSPSYDFFSYYLTLIITPMFMLCGVFYPISTLPSPLQYVVQLLPLTHAVALIRPLATGGSVESFFLHLLVLIGFALVGFYLSVVLTRRRFIF